MTTLRLRSGLLLAMLLLAAAPAAAFDIDFSVTNKDVMKYMSIEKPTAGRAFVGHVASYLRVIPKNSNHVAPAFISTHNYLTCPNEDKKWKLNDVKQVSLDRRSGVMVLGFFFDTPGCDKPTFHLEPIVADS